MRYPYNNAQWTADYRRRYDRLMDAAPGGRRRAERTPETVRASHLAAVAYADQQLTAARRARGDDRPVDTIARGVMQETGVLKPGTDLDGSDEGAGRYQRRGADTDTGAAPTGRGPFGGSLPAGGVVARLRRRRAGLAGAGAGAQAIADRGAAAGGMTGPGAQARAVRRSERRAGMGAGGVAVQMPGFARVRAIGAALRARRAGLADRPDVEELADDLAEAIEAGDIGAAEIPEAAAGSGSAGAELLAALAAAAADAPDDDLSDVLAAVAEAAAGAASACTCPTSSSDEPMMPSAAVLASIASQLQGAGLAAPSSGRFGRLALAERETAFRLARIAGLAAGGISNQVVNTNKTLAAGSAIYAVAFDVASGAQLFDVALSNVTISGDNVYQGPLNATDFTSLNSNGQQQPGLLITRSIPTGTQITFSIVNNTALVANVLVELRCQATNAVGNIDGSCSA